MERFRHSRSGHSTRARSLSCSQPTRACAERDSRTIGYSVFWSGFLSARLSSGPVPSKAAFEGTVTKQTANIVSELRRMTARFEQHGHEMASPRAVHTPPGGQARTPMGQTTKTMTFEVHHDRRQMDRLQVPVCPRCDSVSRVRPKFRTREQVYFHCVSCGQYMVELKPDHPPSPDMTLARAAPSH